MNHSRYFAIGLACLGVLTLSACGGSDSNQGSAPSVSPASPSPKPSTKGVELSKRGNVEGKIGDVAAISDSDGNFAAKFVVTDIELDPQCTAPYAQPPKNGHFVALKIDVEGGSAELMKQAFYTPSFNFAGNWWKFLDPNNTVINDVAGSETYSCMDDSQRLPDQIGPTEKASGYVVLDVPTTSGIIEYIDPSTQSGWEWNLDDSKPADA